VDTFEELVMFMLTRKPYVFLCPQYCVRTAEGKEWSYPDFVVLNFKDEIISVVEVTAAANPKALFERLRNKEYQWLEKLRRQLEGNRVVKGSWNYRIDVYAREEVCDKLTAEFARDT
jgi:hypothetical protein